MSSSTRKRQRRRAACDDRDELTLHHHKLATSPCRPPSHRQRLRLALLPPPPDSADVDASTLQRSRALVGVAQTYFELFRHGFIAHDHAPLRFLEALTDPAVGLRLGITTPTSSNSDGPAHLLAQWRRYTELFAIRVNELREAALVLQQPEQTVVRCRLTFRGRLTAAALQRVFPLAWRDPGLRVRALDRRVACDMVFHLFFDGGGRLVRHDAEADFLSTMLDAFGDIAAAAAVVAGARLGPEATIEGDGDHHRQQQQQQQRRRLKQEEEKELEHKDAGATSNESTPPSPQLQAPPPRKMKLAFVLS